MTAMMIGNVTAPSRRNRVESYPPGFDLFAAIGTARLTNVAANNWDILDDADQPLLITASAPDPVWLLAIDARIELNNQTITATTGDVLKIGQSVADTTFVANSAAAASSLMAAGQIRSTQAPFAVTQITANATFRAFLHNGSNAAAGGNLTVVPGAASGLLQAGRSFIRVPVRILFLRRSPALDMSDIPLLSVTQQRLDAGIV
jgi:hypothetical protein